MGVSTFISRLETSFLNQLSEEDLPPHADPNDGEAVRAWVHEAFGRWFLQHRDDLLGREWARRGWAEFTFKPSASGGLRESYRLKPEHVETIDRWMQDEIE